MADPKRSTQQGRVLHMLQSNPTGVCSTVFIRERIPRFSARISELRRSYQIVKIPCDNDRHGHVGRQWAYRLEQTDQVPMF